MSNSPAKKFKVLEETVDSLTIDELKDLQAKKLVEINFLDKEICRISEAIAKQKEGK